MAAIMMSFCPIGRPIVFNSNAIRPYFERGGRVNEPEFPRVQCLAEPQDVAIALRAPFGPEREFGQHRCGDADPVAPGDLGRSPLEHATFAVEVQRGDAGVEDEPSHRGMSSPPSSA
jgi:hypothetical protein